MKALTKAQLIEKHRKDLEYYKDIQFERGKLEAQKELQVQFASAKLAQLQAAAKLMEEAGRVMSRAGYMIGKINQDNSR